ncbi:hypothetical protein JCM10450v2_001292 [Rhodotorula kratochvilovae]
MPRAHPLSCLRLKLSKTTVLLPVTPSTTLPALRISLLAALTATASAATSDDPDLPALPSDTEDIALWRLDAPERDADGNERDKWVLLRDETSGADKWGVNEGDELGVSFKAADGSFPEPTVVRPADDDEAE